MKLWTAVFTENKRRNAVTNKFAIKVAGCAIPLSVALAASH